MQLLAWLQLSRSWSTPLHHLATIGAARATQLLRDGANLHASTDDGASPLALALDSARVGSAPSESAAGLVLLAAEPWSPENHALFGAPARERACDLLWLGHGLSKHPLFVACGQALVDIWKLVVMPHAVNR